MPAEVIFAKIVMGLLMIAAGVTVSRWALRRPVSFQFDWPGYFMFMSGGAIGATGALVMLS